MLPKQVHAALGPPLDDELEEDELEEDELEEEPPLLLLDADPLEPPLEDPVPELPLPLEDADDDEEVTAGPPDDEVSTSAASAAPASSSSPSPSSDEPSAQP